MVNHVVRAAYYAERLPEVVTVEAGPGAVGLGAETGRPAACGHRRQLHAAVGKQPEQVGA